MKVIDDACLKRFREKMQCEWCHARTNGCHPHHWIARGHGGGRQLDLDINLIGLCYVCHAKVHAGNLTGRGPIADRAELLAVIARREDREGESIEQELWRILRTPRQWYDSATILET